MSLWEMFHHNPEFGQVERIAGYDTNHEAISIVASNKNSGHYVWLENTQTDQVMTWDDQEEWIKLTHVDEFEPEVPTGENNG